VIVTQGEPCDCHSKVAYGIQCHHVWLSMESSTSENSEIQEDGNSDFSNYQVTQDHLFLDLFTQMGLIIRV
jgi:hypothetical protein